MIPNATSTLLFGFALLVMATDGSAADADMLDAAIRTAVAASNEGLPGVVETAVVGRCGQVSAPPNSTMTVRVADGIWPRERAAVDITYRAQEQVVRRETCWLAVHWWREVVVYERAFPRSTAADTLVTHLQRVDFVHVADAQPLTGPLPAHMRLRRPVRAGQPVLETDFETAPDVARNQRVTVALEHGAIRLSTHGRALREGFVGEQIPVRVAGSHATVLSTIVSPEVVHVAD